MPLSGYHSGRSNHVPEEKLNDGQRDGMLEVRLHSEAESWVLIRSVEAGIQKHRRGLNLKKKKGDPGKGGKLQTYKTKALSTLREVNESGLRGR